MNRIPVNEILLLQLDSVLKEFPYLPGPGDSLHRRHVGPFPEEKHIPDNSRPPRPLLHDHDPLIRYARYGDSPLTRNHYEDLLPMREVSVFPYRLIDGSRGFPLRSAGRCRIGEFLQSLGCDLK